MAKDPAFLFYTNDFDAATKFFSDEQVGIYLRLLIAHHQHGRLKENQVKFICKSMDQEILSKFSIDECGLYYNERLEEEVSKRKKHSEKQKENIAKRYQTPTKPLPNGYQKNDLVIPLEDENEIEIVLEKGVKGEKQKWEAMPLPENVGSLPEIKIGSAKQLLKITKQVDVSDKNLIGMWEVFKIQNLTGKKYYQDLEAVHSHFINWIKTQTFGSKGTIPDGVTRLPDANEVAKKYA